MERGRTVLEKVLQIKPDLARANYFFARVLRAEGKYDEAAARLHTVLAQYPRDRLRAMIWQGSSSCSASTVMRCRTATGVEYRPGRPASTLQPDALLSGSGPEREGTAGAKYYLRFKADEAAQQLTGPYRQQHPEDNNERQAIHEHESVPVTELRSVTSKNGNQKGIE